MRTYAGDLYTAGLRIVVENKSAQVHATRPNGTVGNDKLRLFFPPAFKTNVKKSELRFRVNPNPKP